MTWTRSFVATLLRIDPRRFGEGLAAWLVAIASLAASTAHAETYAFSYSARLTHPDGAPVLEAIDVDVSFYDVPVGGERRGNSPYQFSALTPRDGVIVLDFNLTGADAAAIFTDAATETWLEVTDRTHGRSYPRQRFSSVPYALKTPVDEATLGYDGSAKLAVRAVPASAVTGLVDALASKAATNQSIGGDVTGNLTASTVGKLRGVSVSANAPADGQVLTYSGGEWRPQVFTISSGVPEHVLGSGDQSATPQDGTIRAADAAGSNVQGADLSIAAGNGTGSAGSGSILLQTAAGDASPTDADTLTTRLAITAAGNVGIGTATPGAIFEVTQSTANFQLANHEALNITYNSGSGSGGNWKGIRFRGTPSAPSTVINGDVLTGLYGSGAYEIADPASLASTGAIRIMAAENFAPANRGTSMRFEVTPLGSTNRILAMTLDPSGKVGIGTSLPQEALEVAGIIKSGGGGFMFADGTTMTSAAPTPSSGFSSTTDLGLIADSDSTGSGILSMTTKGVERLRITNTGNIGIGTTAPTSALQVSGTLTTNAITAPTSSSLALNAGGGNIGIGTSAPMSTLDINGNAAIGSYTGVHAAPSNGLIVSGNVGIGTHSPTEMLEVAGTVKSTSGGFVFPDGSTMTTAAAAGTASTSSTTDLNLIADSGAAGTGAMIMSTNGNERMRIANGGNIGIGTTAPNAPLQIHSTTAATEVRLGLTDATTGATSTDGVALIKNYQGDGWLWNYENSALRLGTSNTERLSILSNGNVGIGTTAPKNALDVNGRISLFDNTRAFFGGLATEVGAQLINFGMNEDSTQRFGGYSAGSQGGLVRVDARAGRSPLQFYVRAAGDTTMSQAMFITSAGNVGIGGNTATNKLSVIGGANFTENVGIGTTVPAQALDVVGAIKSTGGIIFPDGTTMTTAASASTGSSSTTDLSFAADSDVSGAGAITLVTAGAERLRVDNNGNVGIGSATPQGLLDVAGKLIVSSAGNVGVGTTLPQMPLQIGHESSQRDATIRLASGNGFTKRSWDISTLYGGNTSTPPYYGLSFAESTGGTASTTRLYIHWGTGNIGMGTTAPTSRLDVTAGASGSLTEQLVLRNSGATTTAGTGAGIAFALTSASTSRHAAIDAVVSNAATGASDLLLATHDGSSVTEKLRIQAGGSVGIGTSSPANKLSVVGNANVTGNFGIGTTLPTQSLDVAGAIRSSSGGFIFPDGTTMTTAVAPGGGSTTSTGDLPFAADTTASGSGDISFATGGAERLRITNAGNTGIATATPKSKLDVAGGVAVGTYAGVNAAPSNSLIVSGNVGIGTTAPANKLSVSGTADFTGNVGIGTTNPLAALDVYYTTTSNQFYVRSTSSGIKFANNGTNYIQSAGAGMAGAADLRFTDMNAANTWMTITSNGNVGIGTSAPANKLSVSGTANFTGNVGIGTTTPTEVLEVAGRIKSTTGGFVFPDGSVMTTAAATSTGETSLTDLAFAADSDADGSGAVTISTRGVERLRVDNGGNVGIGGSIGVGTTSPSGTLHVAGATSIFGAGEGATPAASTLRGANAAGTNVTGANLTIQASNGTGTGGSGAINFQTAPAGTTGSSPNTLATVMTITKAGNVGIGTTSPVSKLSITDESTVASRGLTMSQNTADAAAALANFRKSRGTAASPATVNSGDYIGTFLFNPYVSTSGYMGTSYFGARVSGTVTSTSAPTDIFISTSSTNDPDPFGNGNVRMLIASTGNVGIGTTVPAHRLEVAGSIRSSSGGFVFPDGSVMTTAVTSTTGGATSTTDLNLAADTGATGTGAIILSTAGVERARIVNGGNIGIGTSSPKSSLDVAGGVALGSYAGVTAAANNTLIMGGTIGVGLTTVSNTVDIATVARSGTHATARPLYVTGNFSSASAGVEFRHTNGTLGIGFGYDSIYQAGSNVNGNLNIMPKGSGNVGIGTTAPAGVLDVKGLFTVLSGGNVGVGTTTPGYKLHVNGSVAGVGSFTQLSDARYKKDVQTLADSLTKLLAIRGVSYRWIDEDAYGDASQIGVIAQEIEQIVPEVVDTGADGIKRVKYADLIPLVIEAFKEERAAKDAEIARLQAAGAETSAEASQARAEVASLRAFLCTKFPDAPDCPVVE